MFKPGAALQGVELWTPAGCGSLSSPLPSHFGVFQHVSSLVYRVSEQVSSSGSACSAGLVRLCSSRPTRIAPELLDGNKPLHHLSYGSRRGIWRLSSRSCDAFPRSRVLQGNSGRDLGLAL